MNSLQFDFNFDCPSRYQELDQLEDNVSFSYHIDEWFQIPHEEPSQPFPDLISELENEEKKKEIIENERFKSTSTTINSHISMQLKRKREDDESSIIRPSRVKVCSSNSTLNKSIKSFGVKENDSSKVNVMKVSTIQALSQPKHIRKPIIANKPVVNNSNPQKIYGSSRIKSANGVSQSTTTRGESTLRPTNKLTSKSKDDIIDIQLDSSIESLLERHNAKFSHENKL